MTLYSILHGPEFWLALAIFGAALIIFDLGILFGMWLSALFGANREEEDDESKRNL